MSTTLMFTGDINLMNERQKTFARVGDVLRRADVRFANLECCFTSPARVRIGRRFFANLRGEGTADRRIHAVVPQTT